MRFEELEVRNISQRLGLRSNLCTKSSSSFLFTAYYLKEVGGFIQYTDDYSLMTDSLLISIINQKKFIKFSE